MEGGLLVMIKDTHTVGSLGLNVFTIIINSYFFTCYVLSFSENSHGERQYVLLRITVTMETQVLQLPG